MALRRDPLRLQNHVLQRVHAGRRLVDLPRERDRPGQDRSWLDSLRPVPAEGLIRLGYIGHLQSIKGVDVLLRAFSHIQAGSHLTLDVWGSLESQSDYIGEIQRMSI